jgi:hypothetical protein
MGLGEDDFGFDQRRNADGTVDLVCMQCSQIVAMGIVEPDFEQFEREHVCTPDECAPRGNAPENSLALPLLKE